MRDRRGKGGAAGLGDGAARDAGRDAGRDVGRCAGWWSLPDKRSAMPPCRAGLCSRLGAGIDGPISCSSSLSLKPPLTWRDLSSFQPSFSCIHFGLVSFFFLSSPLSAASRAFLCSSYTFIARSLLVFQNDVALLNILCPISDACARIRSACSCALAAAAAASRSCSSVVRAFTESRDGPARRLRRRSFSASWRLRRSYSILSSSASGRRSSHDPLGPALPGAWPWPWPLPRSSSRASWTSVPVDVFASACRACVGAKPISTIWPTIWGGGDAGGGS